jgi:hypothetical protein
MAPRTALKRWEFLGQPRYFRKRLCLLRRQAHLHYSVSLLLSFFGLRALTMGSE